MAILVPDRNVWRLSHADRFAVLIDGAALFGAVRQACIKAQRSIVIMGWDLDSRTRLVGETGVAEDGYPIELAPFLSALVEERPQLRVQLLLWDYSVLYATERELFPTVSLQWKTPPRVTFALDDQVPAGASQHQKIVVIDDSVAFSGGLDLTIRRWDTSKHEDTQSMARRSWRAAIPAVSRCAGDGRRRGGKFALRHRQGTLVARHVAAPALQQERCRPMAGGREPRLHRCPRRHSPHSARDGGLTGDSGGRAALPRIQSMRQKSRSTSRTSSSRRASWPIRSLGACAKSPIFRFC